MSDNHSINLADDNFVRSVINRQVGKLIAKSDFTQQDRSDLVQEVYVRATKSLRLYDPSVGHLYPYVCTVVQRHLANVVRDRSVSKRATAGRVSLSKSVRSDDGGPVEMSQTLHHQDQDRRLGNVHVEAARKIPRHSPSPSNPLDHRDFSRPRHPSHHTERLDGADPQAL